MTTQWLYRTGRLVLHGSYAMKALRVVALDGGFIKWLEEGRPTTSQSTSYPQGNFAGVRKPELFVTKEDVGEALEDENTIIVDSLPSESYNGDPNSTERSGHISGSVNIFFGLLSNFETKELYPDEKIRETLEKMETRIHTLFYFPTKKLQKGILEERSLFEALGIVRFVIVLTLLNSIR